MWNTIKILFRRDLQCCRLIQRPFCILYFDYNVGNICYVLPITMIVGRSIIYDHINIFGYHYGKCGRTKTSWISLCFLKQTYLSAWIRTNTLFFYFLFVVIQLKYRCGHPHNVPSIRKSHEMSWCIFNANSC